MLPRPPTPMPPEMKLVCWNLEATLGGQISGLSVLCGAAPSLSAGLKVLAEF